MMLRKVRDARAPENFRRIPSNRAMPDLLRRLGLFENAAPGARTVDRPGWANKKLLKSFAGTCVKSVKSIYGTCVLSKIHS